MRLEDYFDFEKFVTEHGEVERIRIKGHRISVEDVVESFNAGMQPKEICERYPTLTPEEVYATITYYLHNKGAVDDYMGCGEKVADAYYQEYLQSGPYFLRDKALNRPPTSPAAGNEPPHA